ncbi:unnamed protein product [Moneuplotes crassus]|uniref:Uncharacterized protein n=1 Tax=Euplotes crassus TaxID=5936 RepID=A0AAD1Y649_EUPCR|nr:unnamed protein product [Moneuplotes crassus]
MAKFSCREARAAIFGSRVSQKAFLVFLAIAMMTSMAQETINHIPLKADGTEIENSIEGRGAHHYKVKIDQNYEHGMDLVLSVRATGAKSDPDLFISTTEEAPTSRASSEYSCSTVGDDICTIPSSAISPGTVFYVTTNCYKACGYTISADLLKEVPIGIKKDHFIIAKSGEKRIFTFKNTHEGVKDIYIIAQTIDSAARMRMYVKDGEESVPTTNDMSSSDVWKDGIVLKITNFTAVKVQQDQTYKILFEADEDLSATLRVDLVYKDREIFEGKTYEDFLYHRDSSCYKYKVKSTDKTLRIGVYSFSGNPDIYATSEIGDLNNLEKYDFKSTEPSDDVLVITPEDRKQVGQMKGWYYICVTGHGLTSYRLRVAESNQEYFLEDGIAETNEIKTDQDMTFYYTDDSLVRDLNITFILSTHGGPIPKMYVKFCGRKTEEQCKIFNKDDFEVQKSTLAHGEQYSFITHHGKNCGSGNNDNETPCMYAILVSSPKTMMEKVSHFSLVAHHNETSHLRLREGIAMENIVENHQFKYFRFIQRDSSVTNVTFTLKSHHGDADMYVSTVDKYPDGDHFEKKSERSSRFADEVTFSKTQGKGSLLGVYYIGVKGLEYTSFSLRASLKREGEEEDKKTIVPILLREGVTHNEFLHGENDSKYFRFKTSMDENSLADIRITLTASSGDYSYYVKSGSLPKPTYYDYASLDGSDIMMKKTDEKFKPKGIKYILVVPNHKVGPFPQRGRFSIKYSTGHGLQPIKQNTPVHGTVKIGEYDYFRYHSLTKVDQLTVSLTPLSGESDLVVSTDPSNDSPTMKNSSYHSSKVGKDSILIDGRDLFESNPSCDPKETARTGENPCEIYIGVYCADSTYSINERAKDSCSFSLKVYSNKGAGHLLHDGTPQKDHVKETEIMTYYMPLDKSKENLYITANAEVGDIKLYAIFADHSTNAFKVLKPSTDDYVKASTDVGHSQMIHFTRKEVKKDCEDFEECMVVISVEGKGSVQFNEYSITAYNHLRRLIPNSPTYAVINKGQMGYFTYKSYCEDCTIFLSAATFAIDSDIDMYLNIGSDKDLPTPDSYDIKRDEWFTEHIELDSQSEYFKKKGIETMQNTILIGIYAKEDSIVYVDAEESKGKVKSLTHGKGVLIDQKGNELRMFQYIHKGDDSLKFELTGLHGEVVMRVNCYDPHQLDSPMNAYIPTDDKTSKWRVNSMEKTAITIENEDENYCKNGVYLATVNSNPQGAKYTIEVQKGETFITKTLKIGVPVKDQIAFDHEKQYMFVLDKKKPFRITSSIYAGKISFMIGDKKDFKSPIMTSKDGQIVVDDVDIGYFKARENIYVRVKGDFDHSEFILVATHDDSYSIIADGYTQTYTIDMDNKDGLKLMYYPPNIDHELKIQVNGFTDSAFFYVGYKKEYLRDIRRDHLSFPNQDLSKVSDWLKKNWNPSERTYVKQETIKSDHDNPHVILLVIIPENVDKENLKDHDSVQVSVNINSHKMNILAANIPQEVTLSTEIDDYSYFKFFVNGRKDIEINLTPCMCMTEMFIFKSYENAVHHSGSIQRSSTMVNGIKSVILTQASGPYFVKVKSDPLKEWEESRNSVEYCAFQMVFYDLDHPNSKYSLRNYYPQDEGRIEYDWPQHAHLHLKWGHILKEGKFSTEEFLTIGTMLAFKERSIFTNSLCGLRHHRARHEPLYEEFGLYNQEKTFDLNQYPAIENERYVTFYFYASVNRDKAAVLFQPLTVSINVGWLGGVPWFIIFFAMLIIAALAYAVYYYKNKADTTQGKLDYEMNDIRNVARVPYADDTAENRSLT